MQYLSTCAGKIGFMLLIFVLKIFVYLLSISGELFQGMGKYGVFDKLGADKLGNFADLKCRLYLLYQARLPRTPQDDNT